MKKTKQPEFPEGFPAVFICIVSGMFFQWEPMADTSAVNGKSVSKKAHIFGNKLKIQAFCFYGSMLFRYSLSSSETRLDSRAFCTNLRNTQGSKSAERTAFFVSSGNFTHASARSHACAMRT